MMAKYVPTRVPEDVYKELVSKQTKFEDFGKKILGKSVKIPLTKVMRIIIKRPIYIQDDELISFIKRGKRR